MSEFNISLQERFRIDRLRNKLHKMSFSSEDDLDYVLQNKPWSVERHIWWISCQGDIVFPVHLQEENFLLSWLRAQPLYLDYAKLPQIGSFGILLVCVEKSILLYNFLVIVNYGVMKCKGTVIFFCSLHRILSLGRRTEKSKKSLWMLLWKFTKSDLN